MDHIVYLDSKAKELDKILTNKKTMIVRGATGRKLPYGRVNPKDTIYFLENNGEKTIKAKATVFLVVNSEKLSKDESVALIEENQDKLNLDKNQFSRWVGKRYLVLIEFNQLSEIEPFLIDKSDFGNMDDWLLIEDINKVKIS